MGTASTRNTVERRSPSSRLEAVRLKQRRMEILADTAMMLLAGSDPDREVMPALTRAMESEFEIDASLGFVLTENHQEMKLAFAEGFDPAMVQRCLRLDFGQAVCGTVAASHKAIHMSDIQRSLDPLADLIRSAGVTAYACEPLIVGGRLLGTLSFASRRRRRFEAEDLAFFRSIAKHVALARDRAGRKREAVVRSARPAAI